MTQLKSVLGGARTTAPNTSPETLPPGPVATMAETIAAVVEARDHVSFAELDRLVPGFASPSEGVEVTLTIDNRPVWVVSVAGNAALTRLFEERRVCVKVCSAWGGFLVYSADGAALHANNWLPVVLRPGREANFLTAGGLPLHVPKESVASARRDIARHQKAGRPHAVEIGPRKAAGTRRGT